MYQLFDNYHIFDILFPSFSIISIHSGPIFHLLDVALCPGGPQPAEQSLSPRLAKSVAAGLAAHLAGGGATSGDDNWGDG
jgi:hypothetical protein